MVDSHILLQVVSGGVVHDLGHIDLVGTGTALVHHVRHLANALAVASLKSSDRLFGTTRSFAHRAMVAGLTRPGTLALASTSQSLPCTVTAVEFAS